MNLPRFMGFLFALISIFAGTSMVVALLVLAIRFWPLSLTVVITLLLFARFIRWATRCSNTTA